jgi:plasmid stabilization system protein ParE
VKLPFRRQAERDLRWFALYYRVRLPEGRKQGEKRLRAAIELVLTNPQVGRVMDELKARRLPVLHEPFVFIYTVAGDTIEILRVWDARSNPAELSET